MIPTYGDLIAVSHDMPRWGVAGDILDFAHPLLTLSEPVTFDETGTHYVVLRRKDGSLSGPWTVSAGDTAFHLQLSENIDFTPYTGTEEERTHFSFGVGEDWGVLARVLAVRPRGEIIEISAVVENPLVHTADT